jgi:ATP adenylyltransferase
MDYIWTPWRYQYMKEAASGKQVECFFCDAAARKDDGETLVVYRGAKSFIILNRFPYTSGTCDGGAVRARAQPGRM